MRTTLWIALAGVFLLAGCETRLNPSNWFQGRDDPPPVTEAVQEPVIEIDPRPQVAQIARLSLDRRPGGVLLTAVGVAETQGWFAAELAPDATDIDDRPVAESGVIRFRFVAVPPETAQPVGSATAREITAAVFLSDQTLIGARSIQVRGAANSRSAGL